MENGFRGQDHLAASCWLSGLDPKKLKIESSCQPYQKIYTCIYNYVIHTHTIYITNILIIYIYVALYIHIHKIHSHNMYSYTYVLPTIIVLGIPCRLPPFTTLHRLMGSRCVARVRGQVANCRGSKHLILTLKDLEIFTQEIIPWVSDESEDIWSDVSDDIIPFRDCGKWCIWWILMIRDVTKKSHEHLLPFETGKDVFLFLHMPFLSGLSSVSLRDFLPL